MVVLVEAADNNVLLIVTCIHQTFFVVCTLTIDTFNIGSKCTLTIRSVPLHNFLFFFSISGKLLCTAVTKTNIGRHCTNCQI